VGKFDLLKGGVGFGDFALFQCELDFGEQVVQRRRKEQ
jgi:hypothetical protein